MNTQFWEDLGETGIKLLIAVHELGGSGYVLEVMAKARIGRTAWYRLMPVIEKHGLGVIEDKPQRVRLTEKGKRIAELLTEIDKISTSS